MQIRNEDIWRFRFEELVVLKVSSRKDVQRFGRWRKLELKYIGPFRILELIGAVSYGLDFPASMSSVHKVFHILMFEKQVHDEEQQ